MGKERICSVPDEEVEDYLFTCKDCGSHDLIVEHYYTMWQGDDWTEYVERGHLNVDSTDEHRVEHWDRPEVHDSGYEGPTWDDDEEEDEAEEELDEQTEEFYVLCADCEREIQFGWSHPDRGGRIWPAECSDFNPWKCWPEPRYREEWGKRGWLRPQDRSLCITP